MYIASKCARTHLNWLPCICLYGNVRFCTAIFLLALFPLSVATGECCLTSKQSVAGWRCRRHSYKCKYTFNDLL